ncbi:MAG: hypothetical protein JWQ39_577 [Glaciihabitans sp.]|jgi:hypothetical protein|nr:hypothetical protein [Glaciihabitans sp.]
MSITSDEFDYDTFPATDKISVVLPESLQTNDWGPEARLDRQTLANDPLTATLSDMDLAPAREQLLSRSEFDANYWFD